MCCWQAAPSGKPSKIAFLTFFCNFYLSNRHETSPTCSSMSEKPHVVKIFSICNKDAEKNSGFIMGLNNHHRNPACDVNRSNNKVT